MGLQCAFRNETIMGLCGGPSWWGDDGLPDGWLRYVVPTEDDRNQSRWPVHPDWVVVQSAFADLSEHDLRPLVRKRMLDKASRRRVSFGVGLSLHVSGVVQRGICQ
jgi:hypothetical protein